MDDEEIAVRQENEIQVLKSIFGNNFTDLREIIKLQSQKEKCHHHHHQQKSAANNDFSNSVMFKVTLFPQSSQSQNNNEFYVQIDLKVRFTSHYPNEIPKLTLENEKGLSLDQIKKLHKKLIEIANSRLGNEMIYDICEHVQEYLYENNKPPVRSFYEQRIINLEKQQSQQLTQNEHELLLASTINNNNVIGEQLKAQIDQEIERKKKLLDEERRRERERLRV